MSDKSWRFVTTSVAAIVQDASESVLHALSCLSILACIFGLEPFRVAIGNRSNRYMAHHGTHWNAILQSLPSCMVFNTQWSIYLGSSAGFFRRLWCALSLTIALTKPVNHQQFQQKHRTSIHIELHLEACQVPPRGVCQAVSTQVQGGEALQVEQRSIQRAQLVLTQVDHWQVQSIKKTGRQFFECISTQVQQLQGAQIPQVLAGAGINAVQQPQTVSISTWQP